MNTFSISGNIIDIINEEIFSGTISVINGKIAEIHKEESMIYDNYILPGFIDAHVHIESSMLTPSEFARIAVTHGTIATVSDPHEIANVLGKSGIQFMIDNGHQTMFKFYFGAPSCVPATTFETAGATISPSDIKKLFENNEIKYLSEMMNFPGVLFEFPDVMEKIQIALDNNRPIDGHAPGLKGKDAERYIKAGISTDHECFSLDEAIEKINYGMKILIREGSAAKNFDELHSLIDTNKEMIMFCSDDKHPDDLVKGHINLLVKRALKYGHSLFDILKIAIKNPIEHYNLDVGMLQLGDDADFIVVDNLNDFNILKTFINSELVAENGKTILKSVVNNAPNNFNIHNKIIDDFRVFAENNQIRVIEAVEGQLVTNEIIASAKIENGNLVSDIHNDILKIAVINRYRNEKPAIGFVKNFGLKRGAIASSIAHDSHNIIAVATDDENLTKAFNAIIDNKGGIVVVNGKNTNILPLPVAGLMTYEDAYKVADKYSELNNMVKELGSKMNSPFMTLSFMALLVIPKIKLSDKGLFNGEKFELINLQIK